ncbi:MAG: cytochrome c [Pseudolabrys sp.]|nr:cytochrome c [Pseudolabrys sp.]
MQKIVIALAATLIASSALADEQVIKLKPGPGMDKVEANCGACHSLAYIPMNSPFLNAAGWDAAVNKMVNLLKAPIEPNDAKAIKEYLAKNYGG